MANTLLQRTNDWILQFLDDPSLDARALIRKRLIWIWSVVAAACVFNMTMLAAYLQLDTLFIYGAILLAFYTVFIPGLGFVRDFERANILFLTAVVITTFIFMLLLGGINYSFGLFLVGLTCAMASVLCNKVRWTIGLFALYAVTTVLAAFLEPYLAPHPNLTPAANRLLYTLNILWISGSTLMFVLYYITERNRFEEAEARRMQELDLAKTKLFTNITHEFRTPLTVILGLADQLKKAPHKWLDEGARLIKHNGMILLRLVNQMLDLSRLEAGAMPTHFVQGDVVAFLKYLTESFHSLAEERKIHLAFSSRPEQYFMDYDGEKLQLIFSNLVSNALKFTPAGGRVDINAAPETKNDGKELFTFRVKDTGIGIPPAELPRIFDRFHQVDNRADSTNGGSGLGLALTHELIKLLGGAIEVTSLPEQGTECTVRLPVTRIAARKEGLDPAGVRKTVSPYLILPPAPSQPVVRETKHEKERPLLLVVEDNDHVISYLEMVLGKNYALEVARDGKEGLARAYELIPDIILSDVMMPVMDGFAFLEQVKKDIRTSHIPVVMLTAKADMDSRLEGLGKGADAYLVKPFNEQELLIRLEKLIEQRRRMQEKFASPQQLPALLKDQDLGGEAAFLQQVRSILEANLQDEDFGIRELCRILNMSQAQLYRKFGALTDQPIGKYLRTLRLLKARELLLTTDLNVTEAAMEAGFKNLSHFSHIFKKEFGITPSEVVR